MSALYFRFEPRGHEFLPDLTRSLRPRIGHAVPGVLHDAGDPAWATLEIQAGVVRTPVLALTEQGAEVEALTHASAEAPELPAIDHVFAYGTLRRGEDREPILRAHHPSSVMEATIAGTLVDLGPYPGLVAAARPTDIVRGELWRYEDIAPLLTELDEVEGFAGYGAPGSLYRRILVTAGTGRLPVLAWTYLYLGAGGRVIESGDWCRR